MKILKLVIIVNPVSGRGKGSSRRQELHEVLHSTIDALGQQVEWSVIETTCPGSGTSLAREAAESGANIVAAAGGDGTCGEVANGLIGTDACMGVIPFGTGNDFSRTLGIGTSLEMAVRTLIVGMPRPVDLGHTGSRYFINSAGCGFDAEVAQRVNRGYRRLNGTAAYVAGVMETLARYRACEMSITCDGETLNLKAMLCAVSNSQSTGGGMRITPDAEIDDGFLDVLILKEVGKFEFIRAFPQVFKGTHVNHPKVILLRAKSIHIESQRKLPVLVDGDVMQETPVSFTVAHHAIRVMSPEPEKTRRSQ